MKKIPNVFQRDPNDHNKLTDIPNPDAVWVLNGEGTPTRKYDGTCVALLHDGTWVARRMVKPGKTPPPGFIYEETDPNTDKTFGWEPITQSTYHKPLLEALQHCTDPTPGTYELCGPKINNNPENYTHHTLIAHTQAEKIPDTDPRTYETLRALVLSLPYEGIVFHHPDGRMAKTRKKDYKQPNH